MFSHCKYSIIIVDGESSRQYRVKWQFGYENEEALKYHGEFFISGLSAMLRRWIERDCPETSREILDILKRQYISEFVKQTVGKGAEQDVQALSRL